MLDKVLSFVAPHYCCGCDKMGCLLCANCKNNIVYEPKMVCVICKRPAGRIWLCNTCKAPYERVWVVGERTGTLQRLVGLYKFERVKSAYKDLGELLLSVLPELPPDTVVVPVPTTSSRMRERGYDHMLLIAKYIAQSRGLKYEQLVERVSNTKQRQATASKRLAQAKRAFAVRGAIDAETPYLLVDDVVTTGATIKYAAKSLVDAGAKHVWVAVIARQTLD
ncbi:ComF family protein [Candidatus Saccharibacteria bacterium]|nr:ComF family protein [Candidatus Saccharibacteria bacterium]